MKEITLRKNGSRKVTTINDEASLTEQSHAPECDINNIMKKHGRDPVAFQALTKPGGVYADVSSIPDYMEMREMVTMADLAFASLPAEIRIRFRNDPAELLSFVQDDRNRSEAEKLGLLQPAPPVPQPTSKNDSNDKPEGSKDQSAKSK